jgi:hypothetical protein
MKCIIAGGRDFIPSKNDYKIVRNLVRQFDITEIVSGHYGGADLFGEEMADLLDIKKKLFLANWNKYDKKAGPLRNKQMAEYADSVILFKGNKGTDSMRNEIIKNNKRILYDAKDIF